MIVGLDLGQAQDYTALSILERLPVEPYDYHCRYLRRWKLGTSYPMIVENVIAMLRRLSQAPRPYLIVDATGVGRGIVDMFRMAPDLPAQMRAVTITSGEKGHREGEDYRVPKQDLVATMQVLLQANPSRLKIAADLPERAMLTAELGNFREKVTAAANMTYNAREGEHDDILLSVALACWWGESQFGNARARLIGRDDGPGPGWSRVF